MENDNLFDSQEKRDEIVKLLCNTFYIPEEYKRIIKETIKKYATKDHTDEVLEKYINSNQCLGDNIFKLNNSMSLFKGHVAEWLVCMEYNNLKNKSNVVMTIINPDPTSKADLLHVIKTGNVYSCIAGPDVKTGSPQYVLEQWKKIVLNRYEIPMIDVYDVLSSDNRKQLTNSQLKRLRFLEENYPNKKPVTSKVTWADIDRLMHDYFIYNSDGLLPSEHGTRNFTVPQTKEERNNFKTKIALNVQSNKEAKISWERYNYNLTNLDVTTTNKSNKINMQGKKTSAHSNKNNLKVGKNKDNVKNSVLERVEGFGKGVFGFVKQNPKVIITTIGTLVTVGTIIKGNSKNSNNTKRSKRRNKDKYGFVKKPLTILGEVLFEGIKTLSKEAFNARKDNTFTNNSHASPDKHTVKGHSQRYYTKNGVEWRKKNSFSRGSSK